MSKEKELFRDNLAIIDSKFPDKFLLTAIDVAEFTGLERHCVKRRYNFEGRYITKTQFAKDLCI